MKMDTREILKDNEFSKMYKKIISDLGFSAQEDLNARNKLYDLLKKNDSNSLNLMLKSIKSLIFSSSHILIIGGGPDTNYFMQSVRKVADTPYFNENSVLLVAIDGATELLAEYGLIPDIIFTDLDGILLSTVEQSQYKRTYFVIHAHGDNQAKLSEFRSIIQSNKVIGTTQTVSKIPVINTGGFTDGDRALHFLSSFLTSNHILSLCGFDFGSVVGEYSKPHLNGATPASIQKQKKMKYGAILTRDFCLKTKSQVQFLEYKHHFLLTQELKKTKTCKFLILKTDQDIIDAFGSNQLYLKKKL